MRWFGPSDPVKIQNIMQAGASGIVTALHHVPNGQVWSREEIGNRRNLIRAAGNEGYPIDWSVVESVPVHEDIKKGTGRKSDWIENYKETLRNLGAEGIQTVCYNFMPVLDWSRTDLQFEMPDGSRALRFHYPGFAAFDVFILKRPGAEADYSEEILALAEGFYSGWNEDQKNQIASNILRGLPGAEEHFTLQSFQKVLDGYSGIDGEALRGNLVDFLKEVVPVAEEAGIRLAIHPDDPPFPLLGLPRILSTEQDLAFQLNAVPSVSNGFCFCAGSFGARPDNDLNGMVRRYSNRLNFIHLRAVKRDPSEPRTFFEADHLEGDADMVGLIREIKIEEKMRLDSGRKDFQIPMRPDHGHQMLDDLDKVTNPGYSAIGRLRGLAELRGIERAVEQILDL